MTTKQEELRQKVAKKIALADSIGEGYSYVSESTWDEIHDKGWGPEYETTNLDRPPSERKTITKKVSPQKFYAQYYSLADEIIHLATTLAIRRSDKVYKDKLEKAVKEATTLADEECAEKMVKEYERLTGFIRELLRYTDDLSDGQIVKLQRLRDEIKDLEHSHD